MTVVVEPNYWLQILFNSFYIACWAFLLFFFYFVVTSAFDRFFASRPRAGGARSADDASETLQAGEGRVLRVSGLPPVGREKRGLGWNETFEERDD